MPSARTAFNFHLAWPRSLRQGWRLVAISLCAVALSACNIELYNNLDQKQANEMVATLFRTGIPAERIAGADGKYTVSVDESRFSEAIAVLNDHGLPKQEFASIGEVFKNDGIVASPVQERAQMIYALSQELARTISSIDGVLSARVHLVLPENDPLRQQLIPSSASVFIRHVSDAPLSDLTSQVKMLVSNGVAGLTYDKVSVVLVPVIAPQTVMTLQPDQQLVSYFGVYLHRDSVSQAAWLFFGSLTILIGVFALIAYLSLQQRRRVYALTTSDRVSLS